MDLRLRLEKLISGGQTGVDRAALDVALRLGFDLGGYCPRGRRAEDGKIPDRYPMIETEGSSYDERTERNIRVADATLVVTRGAMTPGSGRTLRLAEELGKPNLHVNLATRVLRAPPAISARTKLDPQPWHLEVYRWIRDHGFRVVNVAGTRESKAPGIYHETRSLLISALAWKERAAKEDE